MIPVPKISYFEILTCNIALFLYLDAVKQSLIIFFMKEKLALAPAKPGVYILKDKKDKVLYVGKAKNLKNRLKSYFQKKGTLDQRKTAMVKRVRDFSLIITKNEVEALVLEATLIKQHKPPFNIVLRDDKNYPYLKLTFAEKWPGVEVVRKTQRDGSLYFGPYVPSQSMWDALDFIRNNFPVRMCRYNLDAPMRPCIQYQMGKCLAPCTHKLNRDEYMKIVDEVRLFLSGERKGLIKNLEGKMLMLSNNLEFEEAARLRDRIHSLNRLWESQRVVSPELGDIDVLGFCSDGINTVFDVFFIRNGILTGTKDFFLKEAGLMPEGEILHGFIEMFYAKEIIPPPEIITRSRPNDMKTLVEWLKAKKGGKARITVPQKGKRNELLKMAEENASQILHNRKTTGDDNIMRSVRDMLRLQRIPQSIGAFDVSTTAGNESVGAFICWRNGDFSRDMYRRLRIKGVPGIDDYSMMRETIARTTDNLQDNIPDLIIIDGGKGHLETARDAVESKAVNLGTGGRPMLIAVAKDPDRAFTLSSDVISLDNGSPASLLLIKIRDEAHRFAINYHRKLRGKKMMESPLEKIPGIGKKRRLELLRFFGSIDAIRNAAVDEITNIRGMNRKIAEALLCSLGQYRPPRQHNSR